MTRVTLGKSRVREIRPPGSVRAKAEWLSYSTTAPLMTAREQVIFAIVDADARNYMSRRAQSAVQERLFGVRG
jgi:alpha-D-ribose 1-methylphosphonate 5-triphosphate synthase subunit PhnH